MMDRKRFLWYAAAGAASIYLPLYGCNGGKVPKSILQPELLSHFCNEKTLRAIGEDYRRVVASENDADQLKGALLTDSEGRTLAGSTDEQITRALQARMILDFKSGRVFVLQGWVLSQTEARQCALFSLQA